MKKKNSSGRRFLVACKTDLVEKRQVTRAEAELVAASLNIQYFECCSKTLEGVREMFTAMVHSVRALQPGMNENFVLCLLVAVA